jgi:hypothetical protein
VLLYRLGHITGGQYQVGQKKWIDYVDNVSSCHGDGCIVKVRRDGSGPYLCPSLFIPMGSTRFRAKESRMRAAFSFWLHITEDSVIIDNSIE